QQAEAAQGELPTLRTNVGEQARRRHRRGDVSENRVGCPGLPSGNHLLFLGIYSIFRCNRDPSREPALPRMPDPLPHRGRQGLAPGNEAPLRSMQVCVPRDAGASGQCAHPAASRPPEAQARSARGGTGGGNGGNGGNGGTGDTSGTSGTGGGGGTGGT